MRPILVAIPSKLLFVAALLFAAGGFARDLARRRRDRSHPLSSTPLLLLAGAIALMRFRSGVASFVPSAEAFAQHWEPVPIYSYGVMLGTSLIVGWFMAMRFAKQDGVPQEGAAAIYMWTALWSIVGSRVLYVFTNLSEFEHNFLDVFKIWNGGIVAYGGMIGGFLASWYNCHKRKIPLLRWADVAAPSVVLGTAITRVGCLLFGCDFGARSDLPWAISFPQKSPAWTHHVRDFHLAADALRSYPVHPTQLYESFAGLFLFALLMLLRRYRRFSGQVFLGWVLGYGILRPLIEMVRDDDQRGNVGPLSTSQFIGMVTVLMGLGLLAYLWRRYRRDPAALRLWQHEPVMAGGAPSERAPSQAASPSKPRRRKRR